MTKEEPMTVFLVWRESGSGQGDDLAGVYTIKDLALVAAQGDLDTIQEVDLNDPIDFDRRRFLSGRSGWDGIDSPYKPTARIPA
jgi:hypothetical protein